MKNVNTVVGLPELVPFSFKNGKVRIKTNIPQLDNDGKPVIKNGKLAYQWENKRDADNKPVYDERVILITFIPQDGHIIPPSLSKAKLSKLVKHAKASGMEFLTQADTSYPLQREFEPQTDQDSDDNTITTITAKYIPAFKSAVAPMSAW